MDSRDLIFKHDKKPFYLLKATSPVHSVPLTTHLKRISKELRREMKKLPHKKKQGSLDYFLGGKYNIDEEIRHMQLAQKTLKTSNDDCSLANTVKKIKTCYFSKQLEPLSVSQMRGFQLQEQPKGTQLFAPTREEDPLFGNIDDLYEDEKDETEKENSHLVLIPTITQELAPAIKDFPLSTALKSETVASVKAPSSFLSGMSVHNTIAKRSVAAALRGMRSRFGKGWGRRGRAVGRAASNNVPKTCTPSTRRGRGRPRKNSIVFQRFLKETPSPTPSPPEMLSPASPAHSDGITYSIIELCDLKMRIKIHNPNKLTSNADVPSSPTVTAVGDSTSTSPGSSESPQNIDEDRPSDRPRLILKIRVPRPVQEEDQQLKLSESESEEEEEEVDEEEEMEEVEEDDDYEDDDEYFDVY